MEVLSDERVYVPKQTNGRDLSAYIVPDRRYHRLRRKLHRAAKVLDAALDLARPAAKLVALVKPQFEAGRGEVGKGGVVRDPAIHQRVCDAAAAWIESRGWRVIGIEPSPITGPEGNVEFLLGATKGDCDE